MKVDDLKPGDLVRYVPDPREVKAHGIEDQAIGIVAALYPTPRGPLSGARVLWAGHSSPDEILVEDIEIIN